MHIARLVSHGHSFESASDLFELLARFPLQHTFVHLMEPKRKALIFPAPSENSGLSNFHLIKYDRDTQTAAARYHSLYSVDIIFNTNDKEGLKKQVNGRRTQPRCASEENCSEDIIDARDHILKTTFNPDKLGTVTASLHSTVSHQERTHMHARDQMSTHNAKLASAANEEMAHLIKNGIYSCTAIDETSGCRCMRTFASKQGRDRHMENSSVVHKFPTSTLTSWIHELHLSGKFAFSLATGSRTNRSDFINTERPLETKVCTSIPTPNSLVDLSWFKDACYRKRRKGAFRATQALKADLEILFLQGFQKDGPKQGRNKYTPEQAYIHLKNLKKENGRRKYGHDPHNEENGPLPTKLYIQSWFSRRKNKMAKEEREKAQRLKKSQEGLGEGEGEGEGEGRSDEEDISDVECDSNNELFGVIDDGRYSKIKAAALKNLVCQRLSLSTFSGKKFYAKQLENDDFLNNNPKLSYGNQKQKQLSEICDERGLQSKTTKNSLIQFLLEDNKVRKLKKSMPEMKMVLLQHDVLAEQVAELAVGGI